MATHHTAWKLHFSYPEMVSGLLAGFVPPERVSDLDLSALTRQPEGQVTDDGRERHPDRVWEAGLHDRPGSVLVLIEFQSTVDRTMAARVLVYTGILYQDRLRRSSDKLPPVLPIVVYYGAGEWEAKDDVAGLCAAPGTPRAPYQPSQRHLVLDVGRYIGPFAEGRNWMAELARLARTPDPEVVTTELRNVSARWPESKYDNLLKDILTWLGQVRFPMHNIKLKIPELADARETINMLHQVGMDWSAKLRAEGRVEGRTEGQAEGRAEGQAEGRAEGQAEGRAEGQAEGRAEGQAEVVRRLAARKFGAETAERLAGHLAELAEPERAGEVGEWVLECDSGEELLARVERLYESSLTGDGAPPG